MIINSPAILNKKETELGVLIAVVEKQTTDKLVKEHLDELAFLAKTLDIKIRQTFVRNECHNDRHSPQRTGVRRTFVRTDSPAKTTNTCSHSNTGYNSPDVTPHYKPNNTRRVTHKCLYATNEHLYPPATRKE